MASSQKPEKPDRPDYLKRIAEAALVYGVSYQCIRRHVGLHPEVAVGFDGPTWRGTPGPVLIDMRVLAQFLPLKPPRPPEPRSANLQSGEAADAAD